MAASILHFGQEPGDRFPLLREAGYTMHPYENILEFRQALQFGVEHDAISMRELQGDVSHLVVQAARTYSSAPLVLFRTRDSIPLRLEDESLDGVGADSKDHVDLVVSLDAPPEMWIGEIGALIEHSRGMRANSVGAHGCTVRHQREALEPPGEVPFQRKRAAREGAWGAPLDAISPHFSDKALTCAGCGKDFVFTAGEQFYFQSHNFLHDPRHCKRCLAVRHSDPIRARPEIAVTCANCGVSTTVPFKPVNGRPVYCRACFEKLQRPI